MTFTITQIVIKSTFIAVLPPCILKVPNLTLFLLLLDIRMNLGARNFIVFLRAHNSYYNDDQIAGRFVLRVLC